jgi:hypothetical protein
MMDRMTDRRTGLPRVRDDRLSDDGLLDDVRRFDLPWLREVEMPPSREPPVLHRTLLDDDLEDDDGSLPLPGWLAREDAALAAAEVGEVEAAPAPPELTIHDDLPAFALGALDAEGRARFEVHAADCEACRSGLPTLRRVVELLPYGLPPERPQPGVRERLLDRAREESPRAPVVEPAAEPVPVQTLPEPVASADAPAELPAEVVAVGASADAVAAGVPSVDAVGLASPARAQSDFAGAASPSGEMADAPAVVAVAAAADKEAETRSLAVEPAMTSRAESVASQAPTGVPALVVVNQCVHGATGSGHPEITTLARRDERLTAAEMIAIGLAPIQTGEGATSSRRTERWSQVNVRALAWGTALVFVVFSGLMVFLWSAGGPRISMDVALFSRLPGGQVLSLRGTGAPDAAATMYVIGNGRYAELAIDDLPPLAEGRVYQLWFVDSTQTVRTGGAFYVNHRGDTVAKLTVPMTMDQLRSIAITEEPAPNSPAPTGEHLIAWTR